jgi:RNA ligase (TIGR02306 family)
MLGHHYDVGMRKLASVQRVADLNPIPNADNIEHATVLGWSVVVKRDEFDIGDRCVFFEIDAVLPSDAPWAAFMEPRGFRVKTAKMRGCLSQGLVLPMNILKRGDHGSYRIGDDVTEELGVKKYEPTIVGPDVLGPFPSDVPRTDEIRIQSAPGVLDELKSHPFYVTVKLDGMSGTFINRDNGLQVCSRNNELRPSNSPHWQVAKRYALNSRLPLGFAIQGEVVGPGIQKNRLKLSEPDLFVFNVFDIKAGRYLDYDKFVMFCHTHGLKTVPVEFEVDAEELPSFPFTIDALLQLAEGEYPGTGNRREGIVIRPLNEAFSEVLGGRLSFKCISNSFLLKDEE